MQKQFVTLLLAFVAVAGQAQLKKENPEWIQYDRQEQGYRYIQPESAYVAMPKRSEFWTNICLAYYEGYRYPYYISLVSGYQLSKKHELIFTFSDGKEMHLFADASDVMHSNLGIGKKVWTYEAIFLLDEFQLRDLVSSSIVGIKVGWGKEWHSTEIKKNKVGKFLSLNYKAIQKRLAKPKND